MPLRPQKPHPLLLRPHPLLLRPHPLLLRPRLLLNNLLLNPI